MNPVALDPSEARTRAVPRRAVGRTVLLGALGLAGCAAFAFGANTLLSGVAGPQRARPAIRQRAADWPDLKDGLPALATGSIAAPPVRTVAALPPAAAPVPIEAAAADPALRGAEPAVASAPEPAKAGAGRPARPLPAIVNVPVIGPARQASLVAPARTVAPAAPLASETVRARTAAAAFAASPDEPRAAPRVAPPARADKPVAADKPASVKAVAGRKSVAVEAAAAPEPAADEDTEVFGLKVPSLAPAGRKIRESVQALGDAVKGLPDRF